MIRKNQWKAERIWGKLPPNIWYERYDENEKSWTKVNNEKSAPIWASCEPKMTNQMPVIIITII